ncbi:MAG: CHAP domain-containing protein [Cellulomonadaceae bacterium]|nr:CHAP domain-containing protein [Cellulomonadaceae bacterium]
MGDDANSGVPRRVFLEASLATAAVTAIPLALPSSAAAAAPEAEALIAVAAGEVGYATTAGGSSRYGIWYGLPREPWCAMFVSWCAAQAGISTQTIPHHAFTPDGVAWFKASKRWFDGSRGAQRGDIVYFDFPGAPYRVSHVGVVESIASDGQLFTIEGNTSDTSSGDQRDGGHVARKKRGPYVVGYGRPAYAGAPDPAVTPPPPPRLEDDMALLLFSSRGYALLDGGQVLPIGDQSTVNSYKAAGVQQVNVTDGDWDRAVLNELSTFILFSSTYGYAIWSGGKAIGLGDMVSVNNFKASRVPQIFVSDADFLRLTTG